MRHTFLRLLIITSLLLTIAITIPLAQNDPTITVSPETGTVGSAILDITASGLEAESTYTIEFIYKGAVVFSTDEVADADGTVTFVAASTEGDEPGIYDVQIVSNDDIIAVTEFEFIASDTQGDESSTETVGSINISPTSGPISTLHTIIVRDLDADATYTVEITASATEDIVYRRVWTADDRGQIKIEIFAEDGDTTGLQVVKVIDDAGEIIAQDTFTIDEEPVRNISIDVTPTVAQAGREFTITVSGLAAFDSVSAQITSESNILLDTVRARASSEGVAILSFLSSDDLADATYNVGIFIDDERMAETTLTVGDSDTADSNTDEQSSEVTLTIEPEAGPVGSTHVMTVNGLQAEQPFTLVITTDTGDVEYSATRTSDSSGGFSFNISSAEGDEAGTYPVKITDPTTGKTLATAQMIILASDAPDESTDENPTAQVGSPEIMISPDTGEIGTNHVITLSGMPADTRIGVVLRAVSDDRLALSSVVAIDENGHGEFEFKSGALDIPGDYTVTAVQPSGDIASATFTIEGAVASIDPQEGIAGTTHVITVNGLDADETVTLDVTFDGESVYTTEKTANAEGVATMELTTEEGDAVGDYTITVIRDGNQPVVTLTLIEEALDDDTPEESTDDNTDEPVANSSAQVIEGSLSEDSESIEFEGEEGQYVIISVESADFDTVATVYDTEFYEIAYNDDSLGGLNSRIGPLLFPYTGEYTLEVSQSYYADDGVFGGDFVATIEIVSVASIDFDEPIPFTLSSDTPSMYYAIPAEAGDSYDITIDSDGSIDTVMQVLSYDGYEFAFDDDSGAGFNAEFNNLIFDIPGTYFLVVSNFDEAVAGEGVLTVTRNPVKSLDDGEVMITLNDKVYRDLVVFEGEEGQLITLNLQRLSGDVEDLYINANVDGMQVMSYSTMGVPDHLPLTFVMPMSGQVVVTLEEYSYGGGISFNVTVDKD